MLQDIIRNDEIKLDFFFKASLTNDLVNVSVETCCYRLYLDMKNDFVMKKNTVRKPAAILYVQISHRSSNK